MPTVKFLIIMVVLVAPAAGVSRAEDGLPPMRLVDEAPSAVANRWTKPTVAELRQARAIERRRQRVARMEANAWAGYSPLRPTVPANPYMQLRSAPVRPAHVWSLWDFAGGY